MMSQTREKTTKAKAKDFETSQYLIECISKRAQDRPEFVTFSLAKGEVAVLPERMLDTSIPKLDTFETISLLHDIRINQMPVFGSEMKCRVYKVVAMETAVPTVPHGVESRTLQLEPLFDLDAHNNPTPCLD